MRVERETLVKVAFLLGVLLASACKEERTMPRVEQESPFEPNGAVEFLRPDSSVITRIAVEIAEGDEERARGLMFRRRLGPQQGMLFIDTQPDTQSFWMANTAIPLDMIFVDEAGRVLNVERARPLSRETIYSDGLALYNVEVRAGFAGRHGIEEGILMRWWRE